MRTLSLLVLIAILLGLNPAFANEMRPGCDACRMLTTENSAIMKERGKAAGIKGWIVKPLKGDAVLPAFKKMVDA